MKTVITSCKDIRDKTEDLHEPLNVEDFTPQSIAFASPPKWHIIHTIYFLKF